MMKTDPIIAVKNVEVSSKWYQFVFELKSKHGGSEFDILVSKNEEVMLCLHKLGEHEHPTMQRPSIIDGNGLILYFRTDNMKEIRQNVEKIGATIEEDIRLNENSNHLEFSIRDLDGYYLTISELHEYEG